MKPFTVKDIFFNDDNESCELGLKILAGYGGINNTVKTLKYTRLGIVAAGFFNVFTPDGGILIISSEEFKYLNTKTSDELKSFFNQLFSYDISGIVLTDNIEPISCFVDIAEEKNIPIFVSKDKFFEFIRNFIFLLDRKKAPKTMLHGVLVDVFGVGVLILGKSNVGKSECALELIERGHRLVSDDLVDIMRLGDKIFGYGREMIKYHMEIRGLGIINIKDLFGIDSILDTKEINLVVKLEIWDMEKEYERLGLVDESHSILGVNIATLTIPVKPGRNIPVIIETAALNHRLKMMGKNTAKIFDAKILNWIRTAGE